MNKRQATAFAKKTFGPQAAAVNMSSKNRNQRFGIVLITPGGAFDKPTLYCLGYGSNYDEAVKMTQTNQHAIAFAKQWSDAQSDFGKFFKDPVAYFDEQKKKIEDKEKEQTND